MPESERPANVQLLHSLAKKKLETPDGRGKVALFASQFCRDRLNYDDGDEIPMPRHLVEVMYWALEAVAKDYLEEPCEPSSKQPPASSS